MADFVNVTNITSGIGIAAETIGTRAFQVVKLADGAAGSTGQIAATSGVPAAGSLGLIVAQKDGASVTIQQGVSVSVSAVGTVLGTVDVNVVAGGAAPGSTAATQTAISAQVMWLAPTQTVALVSTVGTIVTVLSTVQVNIVAGGAAPGTTATTQTNVTAQVFWLAPTQTMTVAVSGTAAVTGTIQNVATVSTILGTQIVSVVPGFSISLGNLATVDVTTTNTPSPNSTALLVVVKSGLTVTVQTIIPSVRVSIVDPQSNTQVAGTGVIVWLAPTQTMALLSTVGTLLGTVAVSQVAAVSLSSIVPVTTAASVSVSGLPVWLNPTQTVVVSGNSTVVSGTVSISGTVAVTGTIQNVASLSTILGTAVVSVVPGVSVNLGNFASVVATTTASGLSGVTGIPVWLANPTTVTVTIAGTTTGTISLSSIVPVTTQASVSVSGLPVWMNPTQQVQVSGTISVSGGVAQGGLAGGYLNAIATTSAISSSTNILLQSVYVSTGSTLGTSGWTIGSGSALVIYGLAFGWSQAAANMQATFALLVTTSGTTLSTVTPAWAQVTFSSAAALSTVISTGFVPGTAVGINSSITTIPFPWVIPGPAVVGVAVAATSSGATVYASINAQVDNVIPELVMVANTVTATIVGSVVVSGVVAAVTTQSSATGAAIWLAPTQTMAVVSTVGTVLGTVQVTSPTRIAFAIVVSSTLGISAGTSLLFTVYTGSTMAGAAVTQYEVPTGKAVCINAIYGILGLTASTVVNDCRLHVLVGASGSQTSANQATCGQLARFIMNKGTAQSFGSMVGLNAYAQANQTIGLFLTMGSSITVSQFMLMGFMEG